jgi:hypothetical protein
LGVTLANFNANVSISAVGANTLITIEDDLDAVLGTITLLGVNSANVNQTDFLFGP